MNFDCCLSWSGCDTCVHRRGERPAQRPAAQDFTLLHRSAGGRAVGDAVRQVLQRAVLGTLGAGRAQCYTFGSHKSKAKATSDLSCPSGENLILQRCVEF